MTRPPFDVSSVVPSTRDFLQTLATRRKRLALIAHATNAGQVAELIDAGVAAIAVDAPGDAMRAIANACSVPVLSLATVVVEDDALAARAHGADAVVVSPELDDVLVKRAKATRLAVLPICSDVASSKRAIERGARALVARADLDVVLAIAAALPSTTRVLAFVANAQASTIRALASHVDAAIVDPIADLRALREEVDPD